MVVVGLVDRFDSNTARILVVVSKKRREECRGVREGHPNSNLVRSVCVAWLRRIHREAEPIATGVLLYKFYEHSIRRPEGMYVQISFYTMFKRGVPDKSGNYRWPYFPSSKP